MLIIAKQDDYWNIEVEFSRLDIMNSSELLLELEKVIENAPKEIRLDISKLDFMDSAILGVFVRLHQLSKKAKKKFVFVNLTPFVRNLFQHSRMDKVFNLC